MFFEVLMYILIGVLFLLFLIFLGILITIIALYNKLVDLQMQCASTAQELCTSGLEKFAKIADPTVISLVGACHKASSLDRQVVTLDKLHSALEEYAKNNPGQKKILTTLRETQAQKRFFNNTATALADSLSTFPSNFIGSLFHIKAPKHFE